MQHSGYDPYKDNASSSHRDLDRDREHTMRDPHPANAAAFDRRRPPHMQPSGLAHNHPDYDASHHPPTLSPRQPTAEDGWPVAMNEHTHRQHQHHPPPSRYASEHPSSSALPPTQDHPYRSYNPRDPDARRHQQHSDDRSTRYPSHSSHYDSYDQRDNPAHDGQAHQASYRHSPRYHYSHPYPSQPHHHHDYRSEEPPPSSARSRHALPSPRDLHRSEPRYSPPSDSAARDAPPHLHRYPPATHQYARRRSDTASLDARTPLDSQNGAAPSSSRAAISSSSSSSHHGASASSATVSASGTAPGSTSAARKRKKQFKYMLEHDVSEPSKASAAATPDDDHERNGADPADAAEGVAGPAQPHKESRKKVKKACVFCKRSHMPCEEARPCKRCVKRGISHLCRDAEPAGAAGAATTSATTSSSSASSHIAAPTPTKRRFGEARNHALSRRNKALAETETDSDAESITSSAASSLRPRTGSERRTSQPFDMMDVMPGATARDPDIRPSMSIAGLLSPAKMELQHRPAKHEPVSAKEQEDAWNRSMDARMQSKMKHMLEAGPAAADLSDIFGEMPTSLLMTPAMANLPKAQSLLRPSSAELPASPRSAEMGRLKRSQSMTASSTQEHECEVDEAGFKLPLRPKHLLQEEMATTSALRGGKRSYSYTFGYAKLARWMHTRFSRESCEEVDRSLAVFRPKLMALSRSLPEEELIGVEDNFYQLLAWYQANVLEAVPVPMIVTRRTGEIYAANSHACKLMQLPESIFEGGQICHYQLVTERDCVNLWGKYAQEAARTLSTPPTQNVTLEVDRSLLLFNQPAFDPRTGEMLGDGTCPDGTIAVLRKRVVVTFEAKVSKHGLPFLVTGFIIPIPED
ncbi:hypothetical protein PANT_3c00051 [Moesziomyces antarcticus T-34]|uniref:Zn(2)-C6 fungal-type domain-containing protein n=1 Tax=Pseudozyma antarctica (strain T-34) TaxID=1151754 RepID=M9MAC2_PSEA3|nr:hypothetical protein PANT_3c00051 [Moesziomyces antarcticus T-34]